MFFDRLFSKKRNASPKREIPLSSAELLTDEEKKYYDRDEYYTPYDVFHLDIITFEERKLISYPSQHGLYVAEILLLHYCTYGTYPHPSGGYPGFWWFEYGIRDVTRALRSLEQRGYVEWVPTQESLKRLSVPQLKEFLSSMNLPVVGKKAELIERIQQHISDSDIEEHLKQEHINTQKYRLTAAGASELLNNEYVPFMHLHKSKTGGNFRSGSRFNVWEINQRLQGNGTENWKAVVEQAEHDYRWKKAPVVGK